MGELDFKTGAHSAWNWMPKRDPGVWRLTPEWMRPAVAAAPWITICLLIVMVVLVSGRISSAPGIEMTLPAGTIAEDSVPSLVALMLPVQSNAEGPEETLVYFDDARYVLSDASSLRLLSSRLAKRIYEDHTGKGTVLLMMDRGVPAGDAVKFMELARASGAKKVQIAEKKGE